MENRNRESLVENEKRYVITEGQFDETFIYIYIYIYIDICMSHFKSDREQKKG